MDQKKQRYQSSPTTIAEGLIQFCKKYALPEDNWIVTNGRKEVDLSLTYRLSGLPTHAKLTLSRKAASTEPQEVNVALQISSNRLIHKFPPAVSLWEILKYWEKEKGLNLTNDGDILPNSKDKIKYYMQPVITYTTKEIGTNADLRSTTLAKLGLTSGNGMLRLLHKYTTIPIEDFLKLDQENVVKEKIEEEKLSNELEVKRLQDQKENAERSRIEREKTESIRRVAEEEQKKIAERVKQYLKEEEELKREAELQSKRQLELQKEQEERAKIEALKLEQQRLEELRSILANDQVKLIGELISEEKKRKRETETEEVTVKEVTPEPIDRNPQVFAPSSTPFDPRSLDIPEDFYEVTAQDLQKNAQILKERKKSGRKTKFNTQNQRNARSRES